MASNMNSNNPAKSSDMVTVDEIRSIFDYSPDTGEIKFKSHRPRSHFHSDLAFAKWNKTCAGKTITVLDQYGYIKVRTRIHGVKLNLSGHRVAFVCMTGRWPTEMVDHINLSRADNRWSNLRECSRSENYQNAGPKNNNSTGFKNVSVTRRGRYRVRIVKLGSVFDRNFMTIEEAVSCADSVRKQMHGAFARKTK